MAPPFLNKQDTRKQLAMCKELKPKINPNDIAGVMKLAKEACNE